MGLRKSVSPILPVSSNECAVAQKINWRTSFGGRICIFHIVCSDFWRQIDLNPLLSHYYSLSILDSWWMHSRMRTSVHIVASILCMRQMWNIRSFHVVSVAGDQFWRSCKHDKYSPAKYRFFRSIPIYTIRVPTAQYVFFARAVSVVGSSCLTKFAVRKCNL